MINYNEFKYLVEMKNTDFIMRDHRLFQVGIMPGVTFLEMVCKALKAEGFSLSEIQLKNILFKEPISTTEAFDRRIRIALEKTEKCGIITAKSQKIKGNRVLSTKWEDHLQCELHLTQGFPAKTLDIEKLKHSAERVADADEAYAYSRKVGINHLEFMKTLGNIYLGTDYLLAELHLCDLAEQYLDYSCLHPVYLDASTVVPFLLKFNGKSFYEIDSGMFIPMHIEAFCGMEGLREKCFVYLEKRNSILAASRDLKSDYIELYNEQGRMTACFDKLSYKKVRSKELILNLGKVESAKENIPLSSKNQWQTSLHKSSQKNVSIASPSPEKQPGAKNSKSQSIQSVQQDLRRMVADVMDRRAEDIDIEASYYDQGLDSGNLLQLVQGLEDKLGQQFYPTLLFEYKNIRELAEYLIKELEEKNDEQDKKEVYGIHGESELIYYRCAWEKSALSFNAPEQVQQENVLIFDAGEQLYPLFAERLAGGNAVLVKPGKEYRESGNRIFEIDPGCRAHYSQLMEVLKRRNLLPQKTIHMGSSDGFSTDREILDRHMKSGIYSLLYLSQALMEQKREEKIRMLFAYLTRDSESQPQYAAVSGFARTLRMENPRFVCKTLELRNPLEEQPGLWDILLSELQMETEDEIAVRYEDGRRFVKRVREFDAESKAGEPVKLKENGVYLISGGAGGLGLTFAKYIAGQVKSRLVLTGRSGLSAEKERRLQAIQALGSEVMYVQSDVASLEDVEKLTTLVKTRFGSIDGVIHSAGVVRDSVILRKTAEEMEAVLAPKVYGTVNLDEALAGEKLDFFILFSSAASVVGNVGQCDYAYGNSFMDHYAARRDMLQKRQERFGKTLSINWPLWKEGGMRIDKDAEDRLAKTLGLRPISTGTGLEVFVKGLAQPEIQLLVLEGERHKLAQVVAYGRKEDTEAEDGSTEQIIDMPSEEEAGFPSWEKERVAFIGKEPVNEPIAIIGMGGVMPGSESLESFWENIAAGKDLISEVPADRWDWKAWYGDPKKEENKTHIKWGGFLKEVDKFDPLFFGISPKEAELMDPQQRIFLETVWETIENAGYRASDLSGTKTGLFVGVATWDYYELLRLKGIEIQAQTSTGMSHGIVASRISYLLNLRGPSEPIETACSSSLVAVHRAMESIRNGECDMAIAGGVNLLISPTLFVSFSKGGMLCEDGRCKTFDKSANGYARGEGAGAILLKPLSKAQKDGDHIYGIIRGTAVNHGGRASSLTAPNPDAQEEVLVNSWGKSGIDPTTVSYIEAHGTGTSLGDPIEINGLKKAFEKMYREWEKPWPQKAHCGIGSVKTNIGHLESAAGIAGIIKVLLAMKYKKLPANIHLKEVNPYIQLQNSPFFLVRDTMPWEALRDDRGRRIPRRAGVSSFGFGGVNAHVVLEEYENPLSLQKSRLVTPQLILFSARNEDRLSAYVEKMRRYLLKAVGVQEVDLFPKVQKDLVKCASEIVKVTMEHIQPDKDMSEYGFEPFMLSVFAERISEKYRLELTISLFYEYTSLEAIAAYLCEEYGDSLKKYYGENFTGREEGNAGKNSINLSDMAYTLQIGREAMEERLAVVVSDMEGLLEKLEDYSLGKDHIEGLYRGNAKAGNTSFGYLLDGEEGKGFVKSLIANGNLSKLAQLWVAGIEMDWGLLHRGNPHKRIPLPAYPFARESYWIPETAPAREAKERQREKLHPFLDKNTSTLEEQKYTTLFTGSEFYLAQHVMEGRKVLPAAAHMEMARAAGDMAGRSPVRKIRNIVWAKPVAVEEQPVTVDIRLYPKGATVDYDVSTVDGKDDRVVYSQGVLVYGNEEPQAENRWMDIPAIRNRCTQQLPGGECYRRFRGKGLEYGQSFQPVQELFYGRREALSRLQLPHELREGFKDFVLHPSLLDGALQTVVCLVEEGWAETGTTYLPFSIGEVELVRPLPEKCYAHAVVTRDNVGADPQEKRFEIRIADEAGQVLVVMKDFAARATSGVPAFYGSARAETAFYRSVWEKSELPAGDPVKYRKKNILILDTDETGWNAIKEWTDREAGRTFLVKPGSGYRDLGGGIYEVAPANKGDYLALLEGLKRQNMSPDVILHYWSKDSFSSSETALKAQLDEGVYSVFLLSQALMEQNLHTGSFLYVYRGRDGITEPQYAAVSGLAKAIRLELPGFAYKTIEVKASAAVDSIAGMALMELEAGDETPVEVRYENGSRFVKGMEEFEPGSGTENPLPLKEKGVYVITGGAGGLGLIFARYLAQQVKARLALVGRSPAGMVKEAELESLRQLGAEVVYLQADVSRRGEAEEVIRTVKSRFGQVDGMIHSAGVLRDSLLSKKTQKDMEQVLAPKVYGTIVLDEAAKEEPLDFFVLFSSTTAVTGNVGQGDYAYANSFMDCYAEMGEALLKQQKRRYRILSINWPLWKDGGMSVDKETEALIARTLGMKPMDTAKGLDAFAKALTQTGCQCMVISGDMNRVKQRMSGKKMTPPVNKVSHLTQRLEEGDLLKKLQADLAAGAAKILKISENAIDPEAEMSEFGFDSFAIIEFSNQLSDKYAINIMPSIFFEHSTLDSLARYLGQKYKAPLIQYYNGSVKGAGKPETAYAEIEISSGEAKARPRFLKLPESPEVKPFTQERLPEPIAIVGMSGVMPQSENLEDFWCNLVEGKDLITEIPQDRWDWKSLYGDPSLEANKTNIKWGGFLRNADKFDPMFFGISPREAELMDPQQRVFMETVWKTIEDAGYKASDLSGTQTGVFVGVAAWDYYEILKGCTAGIQAQTSVGTSHAMLANRISYLLNIHGPSEPIDTACSSSLVAIHRAVEAIRNGDCDMAIAGGVSILASPTLYISFSKAGMLCEDGRCKTFDKSANGYVRAEGAGAILLKPLSKAVADGDTIYAVIKGTAVNHGGHVNSLTTPNPKAQAELLARAWRKSGIDPTTAGYIEAHGTGTNLGDPIEINGLKKAFEQLYAEWNKPVPRKAHCGIGAVKTNIGHLETAAGIAGVLKVLLAMKHGKLPGSIHLKELNPYIQLEDSPFYLVKETRAWEKITDATGKMLPRSAGISSFGFGGVNAHVVLEEYVPMAAEPELPMERPQIFLLSAKNENRLNEYAKQMLHFLKKESKTGLPLDRVAYTLQVGRVAMEERLAVMASSMEELVGKLELYTAGKEPIEDLYRGNAGTGNSKSETLFKGMEDRALIGKITDRGEISRLGQLWVSGLEIDWKLLYPAQARKRISLPTYPFAREHYWVQEKGGAGIAVISPEQPVKLHPLIDRNISTLEEQRFTTCLTGNEFYLENHWVMGKKVLPGAAYLEMARAAGDMAGRSKVLKITDVVWAKPVAIEQQPQRVDISLYPAGDAVEYQVSTVGEDNVPVVHSQGKLVYEGMKENRPAAELMDIGTVKARCLKRMADADCYERFRERGLYYGPGFQVVKELVYSDTEALAFLQLPSGSGSDLEGYVLHPVLLDGALQTVICFMDTAGGAYLPFSMGTVELAGTLAGRCYAYAELTGNQQAYGYKTFKVRIADEEGRVLVTIKDFTVRLSGLAPAVDTGLETGIAQVLYYREEWEKSRGKKAVTGAAGSKALLVFDTDEAVWDALQKQSIGENRQVILVKPGAGYRELRQRVYEVNPANPSDYRQLMEALGRKNIIPGGILHLWSRDCFAPEEELLKTQLDKGAYSVFCLARALMEQEIQEEIRLLYVYGRGEVVQPQYAAVSGLLKTIRLENPRFMGKTIGIQAVTGESLTPAMLLNELMVYDDMETEIYYEKETRYIKRLKEFDPEKVPLQGIPLKENGVYLITGGTGALGLIFAKYLARRTKGKLVLTGHSPLNPVKEEQIKEIKALGSEVIYIQADLSRHQEVKRLIKEAKSSFGEINGIIHSAGVLRDALLSKKSKEDMEDVLAPKVLGSLWLDEETKGEPLDFFVLFSSTVGVTGNAGQADYAYANRFLDYYAELRDALKKQQKRRGKTISINWPLWKDGGMGVDKETKILLEKTLGMKPMDTETGLNAFEKALTQPECGFMVMEGNRNKLKRLLHSGPKPLEDGMPAPLPPVDENYLLEKIQDELAVILSGILKLDKKEIDTESELRELGLDSFLLIEFANRLNHKYGLGIMPAILFENPTLASFARYLLRAYKNHFMDYYPHSVKTRETEKKPEVFEPAAAAIQPKTRFQVLPDRDRRGETPIAIIGLSGVMPQSEDLESFWKNLEFGKDLITEVPRDRWNWEDWYGNPAEEDNKTNVKWGGFMKHADKFDPMFFGISPREAELMDPQQRVFMETVWKTIEDAGYRASDLSGTKTGLFVGLSSWEYYELLKGYGGGIQAQTSTGIAHAVLPNRISYLLDLHGPSESIDTACSSSLVAIHRAVEAIRSGDCDMAVAGGVNVLANPTLYVSFSKAGMLCEDGRCKTFDKDANGYVRGEGAGAVLLKPLDKALADGDPIRAVIKGTAVNHGGRTNSLTAPNPNSQMEVVVDAWKKSGIDPDTITYIEAHGTGTSLGDPIEINGLKKAFEKLYSQWGKPVPQEARCGIGAVKTHTGHLEAAAGIAGIIKVLLSMKHGKLPGNIHFKELNPYIQLEGSPFFIVKETSAWERLKDEKNRTVPRRAGVSSFGFGGANAHLVLEEYIPEENRENPSIKGPRLIVLSAKNEERLKEYAKALCAFIHREGPSRLSLTDMAHTLQTGREAMEERLALVASSMEELGEKLDRYCQGEKEIDGLYRGNVRVASPASELLIDGEEGKEFIRIIIREGKLGKLARLWTSGVEMDWNLLSPNQEKRRISLPSYPFSKERYWVSTQPKVRQKEERASQPLPDCTGAEPNLKDGIACEKTPLPVRPLMDYREDFFYAPGWRYIPDPVGQDSAVNEKEAGGRTVLILYPPQASLLKEALAEAHGDDEVREIRLGSETRQLAKNHWEVSTEDPGAFDELIKQLETIHTLYYLDGIQSGNASTEDPDTLDKTLEAGMLPLFRLVKSLGSTGFGRFPLQLKVVTNDVYPVVAGDLIKPYSAGLAGLIGAAAKEFPKWKTLCVDVSVKDLEAEISAGKARLAVQPLLDEAGSVPGGVMAVRKGRRYVRRIESVTLPACTETVFRPQGVYMILGGAGGIGLEVSRYLAQKVQARLVLLGRSVLGAEQKKKIAEIQALGTEVLYIQADAADMESMKAAVGKAREHFGRINGVIHSAVALKDNILENMSEKAFREVLSPKVRGSVILHKVLEGEQLDFMLFFSSAQSFAVNAGQGNYAAACTFQDAYAHFLRQKASYPVKIINWGYWGRIGIVATEEYNKRMAAQGFQSIEAGEGMTAMERILENRIDQVIPIKANRSTLEMMGVDAAHQMELYPEEMPSLIETALGAMKDTGRITGNPEASAHMEKFGHRLLLDAFRRMGVFLGSGERYTPEGLSAQMGITPGYSRLYKGLLKIFTRAGFLREERAGVVTTPVLEDPALQNALGNLEGEKQRLRSLYPEIKAHVNLLWTCLRSYPDILKGNVPATDILFPRSSMEMVENIYKGNREADYYNNLVVSALRAYVEARLPFLGEKEKIKIIEVGAGTGGTSAAIFEGIRDYADQLHYAYTDISSSFIQYGRRHYGEKNSFVEFKILNVEGDVQGQGFLPGDFDIVIASNVLHATRKIRDTLQNAKTLLKTHGWLIMNEATDSSDFLTLAFGLLEGWWLFEDESDRLGGAPLLSAGMWENVLGEEGFRTILLPRHPADAKASGQSVIIAESDGFVRRKKSSSKEDAAVLQAVTERLLPDASVPMGMKEKDVKGYIAETITESLSAVLKINPKEFEPDAAFSVYGVDSILAIEIINRLNDAWNLALKTTDLTHYSTINKLARYIAEAYGSSIHCRNKPAAEVPGLSVTKDSSGSEAGIRERSVKSDNGEMEPENKEEGSCRQSLTEEDIAIIGVSGRYPQARNLDEYRANLESGKDCISEIPDTRWDWGKYYDPNPDKAIEGKMYCKWGGFIEDTDRFDPLFFNISPRYAELMDPQERLFLEAAWSVLEDAGYTRKHLAEYASKENSANVGVFVGVSSNAYQLLGLEEWSKGNRVIPNSYPWSIANRVSYAFNFQGPSIPVDTGCSSGLTAVHLACESLKKGECGLAIAGGVNLYFHPSKYIGLCQARMLSSTGRSHSFGEKGDGFVPGEGVGAVLLKPLRKAIEDRDPIYAVIKGTSVNHGGKTDGYMVPNPNAQADLISAALKRSGINPRTISYVEAQATGSPLGDVVEMEGLTQAFGQYTGDRQFCSIGSVKANIGHLEAASGMAGLTKVLLQMKYKKLFPSIHCDELNPNIDFGSSPFYVQQELTEWKQPVVKENGIERKYPRRAGINAFGAGGANAHIVLEEYENPQNRPGSDCREPQIILLSARNEERLKAYAGQLLDFLEKCEAEKPVNLLDMAYTLQVGREAMEERLALIVSDMLDLREKLARCCQGMEDMDGIYRTGRTEVKLLVESSAGKRFIQEAMEAKDFTKLALLWVSGVEMDWTLLYSEPAPQRISLPVYPFERERYWIPGLEQDADAISRSDVQPVKTSMEEQVQETIKEMVAKLLKMPPGKIKASENLQLYGFDSLTGTKLANHLKDAYGSAVSVKSLFRLSTIKGISHYLINEGSIRQEDTGDPAEIEESLPVEKQWEQDKNREPYEKQQTNGSFDREFYWSIVKELSEGTLTPEEASDKEKGLMRTKEGEARHVEQRGNL